VPGSVGALVQVHGQVQALGFIALFILAVGTRLLPRFHFTHLEGGLWVSLGGLALAAGVMLRAIFQPLDDSTLRSAVLVASGVLSLVGVLMAVSTLGRSVRRGRLREMQEPIILPLTMAMSLLAALGGNLVACVRLAQGDLLVPGQLDEALVHLELWGFASTMIFAIARHTWPNVLLLKPARQRVVLPSLVFWAIGCLGVSLSWLLFPGAPLLLIATAGCQLVGAALFAHALRLFERPARAASLPRVTDPPRAWLRMAFAFLLAGAALMVVAALGAGLGTSIPLIRLTAARHALAQGFLLPVLVFMAARILPGYSAAMIAHPRHLAMLMWVLLMGALLRAGGELIGGYNPGWNVLVAAGGILTVAGFLTFAIQLWRATPLPR
jgi:hypothetical protein